MANRQQGEKLKLFLNVVADSDGLKYLKNDGKCCAVVPIVHTVLFSFKDKFLDNFPTSNNIMHAQIMDIMNAFNDRTQIMQLHVERLTPLPNEPGVLACFLLHSSNGFKCTDF